LKQKARKTRPGNQRQTVNQTTVGRQWLFRLVAMIGVPLLLLGGMEMLLRLGGYGYQTSVFKKIQIGDNTFLVNNDDFSLRFFPPQVARFLGPFRMAVHKPPGTYRIFILGESAAMGDPDPSYGASRYLDALLSARYPRAHFEIINLGITAINSNVILPIARDCAANDGDLWIIYMGNNEMVGPFGAATVFGAKAPPIGLIRLNLALQQTRLGQLLTALLGKIPAAGARASSWGGMEMFTGNRLAANDPRKNAVYQNFLENLDDIVKAGLGSGAKILLNTVAVNLKDCAPFASLTDSNLPAVDCSRFNQFFASGIQSQSQNDFARADSNFVQAAGLDPRDAELQFRWGTCLFSLTNFAEAKKHFQLACDDDALPFRADSRINGIITDEPKKINNPNLIFLDAAERLAADAPGKIPGREIFYEHVHFNFDGNYRLARAWAEQIGKVLPVTILQDVSTNVWAGQGTCESRLGLSDWNRSLVIESVIQRMQRPPLSNQLDNNERVGELTSDMNYLVTRMNSAGAAKSARDFENTLTEWPDDYFVHGNFALFLKSIGDIAGAAQEWRRVCDLIPQDSFACFQLARSLEMQGHMPEAESWLRKAVAMRPTMTDGWIELGNTLISEEEFASALVAYQRAREQRPQDSQITFLIGKTTAGLGRHDEAIRDYRDAIQLNPANWQSHYELGGELDAAGQESAALTEFADAVKLNPDYSRAHFNYGVLLAKLGRLDEAQNEFEETLRLEPGYQNARDGLAKIEILIQNRRN
jgi:tetratricopeptide (TPR) repeat protein